MDRNNSEETAIFETCRELYKMKGEKVCLILKRLNALKTSCKEKFKKLEPIMKIIWLCKENQSSLQNKSEESKRKWRGKGGRPSLKKKN